MSSQTQYPDLAGKAVFITGGATGIGAELVRAFSLQGASVGFIDLNEKAGQKLAESLKEDSDGETWFQEVDVKRPDTAERRGVGVCRSDGKTRRTDQQCRE